MRDGYRFEFGAFDKPDAPKAQALKPLEEAARYTARGSSATTTGTAGSRPFATS